MATENDSQGPRPIPQELHDYVEELFPRHQRITSRIMRAIPKWEYHSIEWLRTAGEFLWQIRVQQGVDRQQMAEQMEVSLNEVHFIEFGVVEPVQMTTELPQKYSELLGKPELPAQFAERFSPEAWPNYRIGIQAEYKKLEQSSQATHSKLAPIRRVVNALQSRLPRISG